MAARRGSVASIGRKVVKFWDESLTCRLNDEELDSARKRAVDLHEERERKLEEKKFAMGEFTKELKRITKSLNAEARAAATGQVARDVRVEEQLDGDDIVRVRTDTGEVIGTRRPTDAELQESLDFGGGS